MKLICDAFNGKPIFPEWNMIFDVKLSNPPYQAQQTATGKRGGGTTLWDKFVMESIANLKPNGIAAFIHPCGWRNHTGNYIKVRDTILKNNHVKYLSIHTVQDGMKTFGAGTRYDWYVVQKNSSGITKIRCEDGTIINRDLSKMSFIPNNNFELFESLVARDGEEKCQVIFDRSSYGSDKSHVSFEQSPEYPYPVIHSLRKNNDHYIIYSAHKNNGHFGIPKVIWGRASPKVIVDYTGEYGMSQDIRAISDETKNLDNIALAMNSKKFQDFIKSCELVSSGRPDWCNKNAMELFRGDFWKEFI